MANVPHPDAIGEEVHIAYFAEYSNATTRAAGTAAAGGDASNVVNKGKLALQRDTGAIYRLTNNSPITWDFIGGPAVLTNPPLAHASTHKSGGSDAIKLNELAAPTAAVDVANQKITSLATPTAATDAATKAYADSVGGGGSSTKGSAYSLITQSLTSGSTKPTAVTDAMMTGKTAGGAANSTGTAGIIASSFASSAAETGTAGGQAGLGSAAAAGQPYNVSDFPGQNIYAECVVLKANGDRVLASSIVPATPPAVADLNAQVYGYLSFRSDLGANLQWRLWLYYRRASDGVEVPITPTVSLANCKLYAPEVFAAGSIPVSAGLGAVVASQSVAEIAIGATGDIQALGTAAAGASGKVADAAHVHPTTGLALSTRLVSAAGLASGGGDLSADRTITVTAGASSDIQPAGISAAAGASGKAADAAHIHPMLDALNSVVIVDDFDGGGGYTTGAAIVPNGIPFGRLGWRCAIVGTAAAVTFVTTNQDASHFGVLELNTGTTTTGLAQGQTGTSSAVGWVTFGAGNRFEQHWLVRIPTLSDGTNTYSVQIGWLSGTNDVSFEYLQSTSVNWRGRVNVAGTVTVVSNGTPVAVAAGAWIHLKTTWDGTNVEFSVDGVVLGNTTTVPTASLSPFMQIVKSAGAAARTVLVDLFQEKRSWTTPRAA